MNPQIGNGVTLFFEDLGPREGAPVILIHGHPFNHSMWAPQTAALTTAGYRVITPDLRGYGKSPVLPGKTTLAGFAADPVDLLDRLDVEQAVVAGVSMGGRIALQMRLGHPGRVRALVLSDTSAAPESEDGKTFRLGLAERLLAEGMRPYADEVIDRMLAPYNVTAMPQAAAHVTGMMYATDPEGTAGVPRGHLTGGPTGRPAGRTTTRTGAFGCPAGAERDSPRVTKGLPAGAERGYRVPDARCQSVCRVVRSR
ncbi:alpha/beta fold hydrolase [Streptomyces sp. NPDC002104]